MRQSMNSKNKQNLGIHNKNIWNEKKGTKASKINNKILSKNKQQ